MCDENPLDRTDPRRPVGRPPWVPPCPTPPVSAARRHAPATLRMSAPRAVPVRPRPTASPGRGTGRALSRRRRVRAGAGRQPLTRAVWQSLPNPLGARGRNAPQPHIGPPSPQAPTKGPGTPGPSPACGHRPRQSLTAPCPLRPRTAPAPPQDSGSSRPAAGLTSLRDEGRDMPFRPHFVQGNKCNPPRPAGESGTAGKVANDQ